MVQCFIIQQDTNDSTYDAVVDWLFQPPICTDYHMCQNQRIIVGDAPINIKSYEKSRGVKIKYRLKYFYGLLLFVSVMYGYVADIIN